MINLWLSLGFDRGVYQEPLHTKVIDSRQEFGWIELDKAVIKSTYQILASFGVDLANITIGDE